MRHLSLFLVIAVFLFSCEPKDQLVSRDEALDFAKKLEFSIKKKSKGAFDSVFNYEVLAARISKEMKIKYGKSITRQVTAAMQQRDLGEEIVKNTNDGGAYEFIRHYEKDGKQHVIFRLYASDGLNYHDLELVKRDGKVRAADMFIYLSGENLSRTMGTVMNAFMNYSKENSNVETDNLMQQIARLKSLEKKGKYNEAKKAYDQLPPEIRHQRTVMLENITICMELDDTVYAEALNEFENKFASDPSSQLALLDAYIMKKDYKKALAGIDIVDSSLQRDPFLNYYRALIYSMMEDSDNAIKYLEILRKEKPGFSDGLLELIAKYSLVKNYANARKVVAEYRSNNLFDQQKLDNILAVYPIE